MNVERRSEKSFGVTRSRNSCLKVDANVFLSFEQLLS